MYSVQQAMRREIKNTAQLSPAELELGLSLAIFTRAIGILINHLDMFGVDNRCFHTELAFPPVPIF